MQCRIEFSPLTVNARKPRAGTPVETRGPWWMQHSRDMDNQLRGDFRAAAFRLGRK